RERDSLADPKDSIGDYYIRFEGDSVLHSSIALNEVFIFGELEFADRNERLRYLILRRKTLKVYPYAKLAAERLVELKDRVVHTKKRRTAERSPKNGQQYNEGEIAQELEELPRSEGQAVDKLIRRQPGKTALDQIKELRSAWPAFWDNATASLFNITLAEG